MITKIVVALLFSIALVGCAENNIPKKQEYNMLVNKYYEKKIPYDEFDVIGLPETLTGTDNRYWVVYFPKGDFTLVSEKKTDIVKAVYTGRNPK